MLGVPLHIFVGAYEFGKKFFSSKGFRVEKKVEKHSCTQGGEGGKGDGNIRPPHPRPISKEDKKSNKTHNRGPPGNFVRKALTHLPPRIL
jgi:hypothetical protein